jgi:hypothetical protein
LTSARAARPHSLEYPRLTYWLLFASRHQMYEREWLSKSACRGGCLETTPCPPKQRPRLTRRPFVLSARPLAPVYDPCTVMFFYRNKHIMIDLSTGNNNKMSVLASSRRRLQHAC